MPVGPTAGLNQNIEYKTMKFKSIKKILRQRSLLTGRENLKNLYTFKNFPVFMGCNKNSSKNDLRSDMEWAICSDTGIIQLKKLIPLEVLYLDQHNDGTGGLWHDHYLAFVEFLKKYHPKNILEIGGAHDFIAKNYLDFNHQASWISVEPNSQNITDKRIKVIKKWFDEDFKINQKIDSVIHSHVLEHAYNPINFIKAIGKLLKTGDRHIFTFPNLLAMLKNKYTNCLNFEHTLFLTEYFTDYILQKYGFLILEKQYYKDHSIFYATEKTDIGTTIKLKNKFNAYKKLFLDFVDYHIRLVNQLNNEIIQFNGPIYLFGAHIFSQYLLNFGLHTDKITAVLDNSQLKRGKRLYGTNLQVYSPEILRNQERVGVILKVANYRDEILLQLKKINSKIVIFE